MKLTVLPLSTTEALYGSAANCVKCLYPATREKVLAVLALARWAIKYFLKISVQMKPSIFLFCFSTPGLRSGAFPGRLARAGKP
jgi:hypothetical protein